MGAAALSASAPAAGHARGTGQLDQAVWAAPDNVGVTGGWCGCTRYDRLFVSLISTNYPTAE